MLACFAWSRTWINPNWSPSHVFVDRRACNDVKASKLSALYTWVLSGSVAMALSSDVLAPDPTPIARTVMPASRAFLASEAVSGGLLDWPSVTIMATLGTFGRSPRKKTSTILCQAFEMWVEFLWIRLQDVGTALTYGHNLNVFRRNIRLHSVIYLLFSFGYSLFRLFSLLYFFFLPYLVFLYFFLNNFAELIT